MELELELELELMLAPTSCCRWQQTPPANLGCSRVATLKLQSRVVAAALAPASFQVLLCW